MFRKNLKRTGALVLAFSMVFGSVQFPTLGTHAASNEENMTISKTARADSSLQSIANSATAPAIDANTTKITMPTVPSGATICFRADYEQIIGEDGTIYKPLEERTVKGFYEISDGIKKYSSKEFTLVVPGKYTDTASANAKPTVVPELQEWHGTSGNFTLSDTSKIIISNQSLNETAKQFAADYKDVTGKDINVVTGKASDVKSGDFFLTLESSDNGLGKEGYIATIEDSVKIEAKETTGAYWGVITALQILKQTGTTIPKGITRDYPKYSVRGFMLDVGRKTFDLNTVKEFAKNLSWYKMSNFQLHLSDNLIFHEDYPNMDAAIANSYGGFRLESGLKPTNPDMKTLHSQDTYYTKDEFRSFIQQSRVMGLNIVPEFDMPAHALPITRAFPEYMTKKAGGHGWLIEELDITNPKSTELAQNIWNDYFTGENPVFDKDTVIHIGTDEFHGQDGQPGKESFRKFSADMIKFVQDSGRTVRMWGSLSNKSGTTPVPSKGVQLNMWSTTYANPQDMYNLGYDMINTLDGSLYIVPAAGYYSDYLNAQSIYTNWKPNVLGNTTLKAGESQMLGACYAVWNDQIDTRINGITEYDAFDRFFKALPSLSAKLWGEAEDRNYAEMRKIADQVSTAPNTNPYYLVDSKSERVMSYSFDKESMTDTSGNKYHISNKKNVTLADGKSGKALKLSGGESYVETPVNMLGAANSISMWVKKDAGHTGEEQILCENTTKFNTYAVKAVQKGTGKVGFSREGADFSFNYKLPDNEWVYLTINGYKDKAELFVNNEFVSSATLDTPTKTTGSIVATLTLPIKRIGSTTKSFKGLVDQVTVSTSPIIATDYTAISHDGWTADACSFHSGEGPVKNAIDDNATTFWHTNYSNNDLITATHSHWFTVTLPEAKTINKLSYLPRQNSKNGRIFKYDIEVTKPDNSKVMVLKDGVWADTADVKYAEFNAIEAKSVKLIIKDAAEAGGGKHGTIAELNLYASITKDTAEALYQEYKDLKDNNYTETSWLLFEDSREKLKNVIEKSDATSAEYTSAYSRLRNSVEGLKEASPNDSSELTSVVTDAGNVNLNNYTADSITAFTKALNDAKSVLENKSASQDDIEEALMELTAAKKNLKKVAPTTPETPAPETPASETPASGGTAKVPAKNTKKQIGNITFKVTESKEKNGTVSVYKVEKDTAKAVIPSTVTIDKYIFKVTSIAPKAFQKCTKLTSVTIGSEVTSIGSKAFFGCKKLKKVNFKTKKAPTIGSKAFAKTYAKCKVIAPKKLSKKQLKQFKAKMKKAGLNKNAQIK